MYMEWEFFIYDGFLKVKFDVDIVRNFFVFYCGFSYFVFSD